MSDERNGFHETRDQQRGPTPECAGVAPLLEDLHDGLLAPEERARVERHVAGCPHCARVLGEYRAIDRLVRAAPVPRVDGRLRAAVYDRIERAEDTGSTILTLDQSRITAPTERQQAVWRPLHSGGGDRPRARRPWLGAVAAAAVVLGLALVMTLLPRNGVTPGAGVTPSAVTGRTPAHALVPAFADWRAAYLAGDARLHVVSLDGRSDITGPYLAGLSNDSVFAGMSPDGYHFAYINAPKWGDLIVVDLRSTGDGSRSLVTYPGKITNAHWSPDGSRLVADSGNGLYVYPAAGGTPSLVPGTSNSGALAYPQLLGWYDNTHILANVENVTTGLTQGMVVGSSPAQRGMTSELALSMPRSSSPKVLATVDVRTGQARALFPSGSAGVLLISPDHSFGIVEGTLNCGAPCAAQPSVERVDFATGHVTALPHISGATNGNLAYAGWVPGTNDVLAVGGASNSADAPLLQLDVDHDTVTTLTRGIYPLAATPDGKTLVAGDLTASSSLVNAYPLYAFAPVSAAGSRVTLTQQMVSFLGLVKTA